MKFMLSLSLSLWHFSWSTTADHYSFWRGCGEHRVFSKQLVSFYIWKLRPASQEGLMGNQSSRVKQSWCIMYNESFRKVNCFLYWSLIGLFFFCWTWALHLPKAYWNTQWVEVLRKPPERADVYLPSWPLRTHCVWAWLVVMDPFNSTPKRKR